MSAKHHRHAMHKAHGGKTLGGEPEVSDDGETAKTKPHEYNAQGSKEAEEVMDDKESFHKGGKAKKKKDGGSAHGHKAHHRLDRKPRASGGKTARSPFTEAHAVKPPAMGGSGQGKEGDGPKGFERSVAETDKR